MSGVKKSLQAATLPWRRFGPQAAAVPQYPKTGIPVWPVLILPILKMETGEQCWVLRWVVFHLDKIQEFHDRSSFRRLGLAVCLGRGLSPFAKGLELPGLHLPQHGPVVTKPRRQKKKGS